MSPALARALCALFLALPPGTAAAEGTAPSSCPQPEGSKLEVRASGRVASVPAAGAGPLDLNSASEAELLGLPGVGPARAKAILAFRAEHGGFRSVAQLLRVKGFGRATLKRLRPLLLVQSPSPDG